jgi:regulator of RNase E activity RraA
MRFADRETVVQLTNDWKGDRFDDGRPRVPDDIITRMERVTTEEAWAVLWHREYHYQFEPDWVRLNPEKILVGRAVTATFVPRRPDLHGALMEYGQREEGRIGEMNSWVIETLRKDDVVVVDLFGKIFQGTFSGGNLSTAIATRTGRGQVIYGGIRDAQQILTIDHLITFCKGMDPTGIRDVTLTNLNGPCRIGNAVCLPGDIVLGTYTGILFIPAHLAEEVVENSERARMRDIFQLERLKAGAYTSHQMDSKWTSDIEDDFTAWRKSYASDEFAHLVWEEKTEAERKNDAEETRL